VGKVFLIARKKLETMEGKKWKGKNGEDEGE